MSVVYTAIFGKFDRLRAPARVDAAWRYVCVCDPVMAVPAPWKAVRRPPVGSARRSSRYYKIMAHETFPDAEVTVWHGGNVRLLVPPNNLVALLGDADIAAIRHSERHCAYDEADICCGWRLDDPKRIRAQMARYRAEGYPRKRGLTAAFVLVRRNTARMRGFNEAWWAEVKGGSVRDQLSIDYVLWKMGIKPAAIPGDIFKGPHFERHPVHGRQ